MLYEYFSHEVIGKFLVIPDTRAHLCCLIKVKFLALIMFFYVLFTVHFVKACIIHTHSVYTP